MDQHWKVAAICFLMPVLYFLAYGLHGLCDTDQGFLTALNWRMYNGEVPYIDFLYVRPPLSLYLHSFVMWLFPLHRVLLIERALFFLSMGGSVYFSTRMLQSAFDFRRMGLSPWLFALMAFVLSVHNFAPMAWHTIDGIFFGAWGLHRIVVGKKWWGHAFGLILLVLAALSKQAFYPMPLVGLVLLGITHGGRNLLKPTILTAGIGLIGLTLVWIIEPLFLQEMWIQTNGVTSLADFAEVAIVRYAKPFLLIVLPLIIVWRALSIYTWRLLPAAVFWLSFFGLLGLWVYDAFSSQSFVGPSYGFARAFFLLAVGISLKGFWLNSRAFGLLLAMLALAWCSGISWGYATPMLYFSPILFGFIYGLYEELDFEIPRYFYGMVAILLVWIFAALYQFPYREAPKADMSCRMSLVFERGAGIKVGDETCAKARELKALTETYQEPFTVLPAYPLAHFLTDQRNPISVDWAHNAEMHYRRYQKRLEKELGEKVEIVFLEKDKLDELSDPDRYGSLISGYVAQNWYLADSSQFFLMYQKEKRPSLSSDTITDASFSDE